MSEEETEQEYELIEEATKTEPEEIEKHHGEQIIKKRYGHEYTIRLSAKENQTIKELQKKLDVDSVKELLLAIGESIPQDEKYIDIYMINVTSKQKEQIEKVKEEYGCKDVKELLVTLSLIAEKEECPKCGYPLQLVGFCMNCAKAYTFDEEDINEELERLEENRE